MSETRDAEAGTYRTTDPGIMAGTGTSKRMACPKCGGSGTIEANPRELFGSNVVRLRKSKGMTQEGLAETVGLSRAQIANIESGRSQTTLDKLPRYAAALGCDIADLLTEPSTEEEP